MTWQRPHQRPVPVPALLAGLASLALSACGPAADIPLGNHLDEGRFGAPTRSNILYHTGQSTYAEELGRRFAAEVPTTITFAFNSAVLDQQARGVLRQQAAFIRHFPEVRFTVYGHTDLVGTAEYNHRLGLRRAQAALDYLVSQGIERSRLEALVSLGETQPIVASDDRERGNRRSPGPPGMCWGPCRSTTRRRGASRETTRPRSRCPGASESGSGGHSRSKRPPRFGSTRASAPVQRHTSSASVQKDQMWSRSAGMSRV